MITEYHGAFTLPLGLYWDNGKENGDSYNGLYRGYRVYIGSFHSPAVHEKQLCTWFHLLSARSRSDKTDVTFAWRPSMKPQT